VRGAGVVQAQTLKLGADHPDTLVSKNGLAWVYRQEERYEEAEAEPLFREVVEGSRRKLGPAHQDTQQRIRNLILCYEQTDQTARARDLRRELDTAR
jgi:hypothetical protein